MPISTNAPFNEFGQSQILRDIEQLYLALNGAGAGAPGDGQTQDQSGAVEQDLSGLALKTYVDTRDDYVLGQIPSITYPISIANGGTGQTTQQTAINALAGAVTADRALVGNGTNVALGMVTRNTLSNGAACSIIGRSANSSGSVADITASADGQVLQRKDGAIVFDTFVSLPTAPSGAGWVLSHDGSNASWDQTVALGNTSAAGSLTIANSTSASAIVLATTLINAAGKVMSVREIDVCDGGTAKKMLVLASAPY
jgi:hypothetical protein